MLTLVISCWLVVVVGGVGVGGVCLLVLVVGLLVVFVDCCWLLLGVVLLVVVCWCWLLLVHPLDDTCHIGCLLFTIHVDGTPRERQRRNI